ncbi:TPA: MerR family transcriptional regulator [Klebsiella aerogenes]|uniref:MerR family transcriptional regulator n=1 Tax=Klebsiella TaxID=570 RepID=UPI0029293742|nr:MerR family transcriptional regulator [Klebsiella sp. 141203]MDU9362909.1 MerR family transcriptional regulator [Klebsiella sp. 141203]HEP0586921.1 MerR family transcriptional regulator [Klebsiella aerogenes]
MNIGTLAKRSGLAPSRIRYYERAGILKTVQRKANGYRSYPEETLVVLGLITTAQAAGFTLEEIAALLPSDLNHWDRQTLLATLQQKVADIEKLEQKLAYGKAQLVSVIDEIQQKPDDIDCAANARRVLSQVLDVQDRTAKEE